MPTVLFEIAPMLDPNWTGIPIFTARLARLLLEDPDLDVAFCHNADIVAPDAVAAALGRNNGLYLRADIERRVALMPRRARADIALFPTVKPAFSVCRREASVVHDLSTIITPEFHTEPNIDFHRRNIERELLTNDRTFAVSKATADDLHFYFGVPYDKISVIHQYVEWPAGFEEEFKNEFGDQDPEPYVAVLGTIEPRKNLKLILESLDELFRLDADLRVVVIGKSGWRVDEALGGRISEWVSAGRLIFSGYVSEFQKYCLLRQARIVVFPSLFEGFGIPVLEAFSVGTPVLASFSSSVPEVGGTAARYFDPLSMEEFLSEFEALYHERRRNPQGLRQLALDAAKSHTAERFFGPFKSWFMQQDLA